MSYPYETIESFVKRLKNLPPTDYVNVKVKFNSMSLLSVNETGTIKRLWVYDINQEWNCLYLHDGKTLVSEILETLEPLVEKRGSSLLENTNLKLIKSDCFETCQVHSIVPFKETDYTKTHIFTKEHHMKWQEIEFNKNLEQFTKLTDSNQAVLIEYLKLCCSKYPELTIYYIDSKVFVTFENLLEHWKFVRKESFVEITENFFVCCYTIKYLEEMEEKRLEKIKREEEEKLKEELLEKIKKEELETQEKLLKEQEQLKKEQQEAQAKKEQGPKWYRVNYLLYTEEEMRVKYPKVPFGIIQKLFTEQGIAAADDRKFLHCSNENQKLFMQLVQLLDN